MAEAKHTRSKDTPEADPQVFSTTRRSEDKNHGDSSKKEKYDSDQDDEAAETAG